MRYLFLMLFILTSGCATRAIQTEALLKAPPDIVEQKEIPDVPFVEQSAGYCGPATLTMALQWAGKPVTIEELGREVYTPGMKGTLQQDLITASRRHGMMAIEIENLDSLLIEIDAGHPVLILENLAFNWYPRWHYALVYGYDLPKAQMIMHSGPEKAKRWGMDRFERSWEYSGYWGLVILPPGQLAASAGELAHLNAALGLEKVAQLEAAEKAYASILTKWPQSLAALIGMGNLTYQRRDYNASVKYLSLAKKYHPESQAVDHNLAVALAGLKRAKSRTF